MSHIEDLDKQFGGFEDGIPAESSSLEMASQSNPTLNQQVLKPQQKTSLYLFTYYYYYYYYSTKRLLICCNCVMVFNLHHFISG